LVGLFLGSVPGFSSVAQAVEPSQPAPVKPTLSVHTEALDMSEDDDDSFDRGPFPYLVDAIEERDHWRAMGYGANVIDGPNGGYFVRVFNP
jgi:hypothetical protein